MVIIDATRSGAPPATIRRMDASLGPLPTGLHGSSSTHALGLADNVELGRALERLPARVIVYGIEGARFGAGCGLSDEVRAQLPTLRENVLAEARSLPAAAR